MWRKSGIPLGFLRARRASVHALRTADGGEGDSVWRVTSEGRTGFSPVVSWEGENEFEGQCREWGLTRRFPWRPGREGGMHSANCGETTGLPRQHGWRRQEGGSEGGVAGAKRGGTGGGAITRALRAEAPSQPRSVPSPAKWLRKEQTLSRTEGLNVASAPWGKSGRQRPGLG